MRKKILSGVIILALVIMIAVSTTPTTPITNSNEGTSKFVISSWEYPDEYGQGIAGLFFQENSTGVWLTVGGAMILPSNTSTFEFASGFSMGLDIRVAVNYTFLGLSEPSENYTREEQPALNYLRLNVSVTTSNGTAFSQQNCTYDELGGELGDGVWWYSEEVYFDFLNIAGEIYTVTVTYEVYGVFPE